jgi:GMP synthase (glutamine-hydrolysing)
MKRALIVRHVPYEGAAGYLQPIEAAGFAIERLDVCCPTFEGADFCAPDLLVMMGGPMGVYEQDDHPWIPAQLHKLRQRIDAGSPTLGVCLGSQMIAGALGAHVYRGQTFELGFAPVALNDAGRNSPLRHLEGVKVLHWHGDTFDLPQDVELLASTDQYSHQGFRRGTNLLALQFHAEMGEDPRFEAWMDHLSPHDPDAVVRDARLRADHQVYGPLAVAAGRQMIAEWLAGLR